MKEARVMARKGFTLIQLLVVVEFIALGAAIAFPLVTRAMEFSATACNF